MLTIGKSNNQQNKFSLSKETPCRGFLDHTKLRRARFLLGDHLGELDFVLFAGFGVDVEFLSLAVWQSWIEAAFPEVIVYLIEASRTTLTDLSRDWLGMGLCGLVRCVYGRVCALLGCFA